MPRLAPVTSLVRPRRSDRWIAATSDCGAASAILRLPIRTRGCTTRGCSDRGACPRLAPVPVVREQIKEGVLGGMFRNEGFVEGNAQARSGGEGKAAV